jgi:methylisocitrate lyase
LTARELGEAGVRTVLYPVWAFRASHRAAASVYRAIRRDGTQAAVVDAMQTRAELHEVIDYHRYEATLDGKRGGER